MITRKLRQHRPVGEEYLRGLDASPTLTEQLSIPIDVVWAALVDGPAWTQWLALDAVEWTSSEPFGAGTTRTVRFGAHQIDEFFFAWEAGRRMAFRFDRSTLPLSAAVEDYRLLEIEGGTELQWTCRASAFFPINLVLGWRIRRMLAAGMPKLAGVIRGEPARFGLTNAKSS